MVMIRTIVMCYSFFILLSILSRVLRISATVVKITINNPITEISNTDICYPFHLFGYNL